ncbi:hypothetical protein [Actinoalloteichus fjordicus]|uniref:PPE family domain-containing protein n=1 Tax=Actinoalloteichus fjordicus TaxID=1612552 RepID=A0AAC9L7T7_9PSEU|nr:hypothetical protein [Actinoalloteichus fjordicus]APU12978.1 hypothetical protein UA74_04495 [Actinoalloteichus fjordicus]
MYTEAGSGDQIRYNRYEGFSQQEKYEWMHAEQGPDAAEGVRTALSQLADAMAESDLMLRAALRPDGLEWEGTAASALGAVGSQAAAWSLGSSDASQAAGMGMIVSGAGFAQTRNTIEPPVEVTPPTIGDALGAAFSGPYGGMNDQVEALRAEVGKADAANRALYAYEATVRESADNISSIPVPPQIAAGSPSATPGRSDTPGAGLDHGGSYSTPPAERGGLSAPGSPEQDTPRPSPVQPTPPAPFEPTTPPPSGQQPLTPTPPAEPAPPGRIGVPEAPSISPDLRSPGPTPPSFGPPGGGPITAPPSGGGGVGGFGPIGGGFGSPGGGVGGGPRSGGFGPGSGFGSGLGSGPGSPASGQPTPGRMGVGPGTPAGFGPGTAGASSGTGRPGAGAGMMGGGGAGAPGGRGDGAEDAEHSDRFAAPSDEIFGLDDLPPVAPAVFGDDTPERTR